MFAEVRASSSAAAPGALRWPELSRVKLTRLTVDNAERSESKIVMRQQWGAGVETDIRISRNERIIGKANVGGRVFDDHHLSRIENGVGVECLITRRLGSI